jgi:transposase
MKQVEAVRVFGVSRAAIGKWMSRYREGGLKALRARPRGRPKGQGLLKGWQAAQVVRTITDRTPDQVKLPFVLWTREAVAALVQQRFGVRVSLTLVGRWLRRWGFTPRHGGVRRAWEQNRHKVEYWLKVRYPKVRREAKAEGAEIHWGDEMGVRSDHQAGTTYGRKGRTPVIPGTGQRWRCNMISTITNRGTLRFMVLKRGFRGEVFIEFLRRLVRSAGRRVYLIVDEHPVHKSAEVQRWVRKHRRQIRMIFLPTYSPDLNPDEFLNPAFGGVKANAVGRRRPCSRQEMMADVRGYLRSTQKQPEVVRSFFLAPSVQYAMP